MVDRMNSGIMDNVVTNMIYNDQDDDKHVNGLMNDYARYVSTAFQHWTKFKSCLFLKF